MQITREIPYYIDLVANQHNRPIDTEFELEGRFWTNKVPIRANDSRINSGRIKFFSGH